MNVKAAAADSQGERLPSLPRPPLTPLAPATDDRGPSGLQCSSWPGQLVFQFYLQGGLWTPKTAAC